MGARGVVRGCGTRVEGGVYLCCPLGMVGRPVEDFLVDPPIRVSPAELGVSSRGVFPIERDGVTHVLDWVGSRHYPNVWDFVEEVRRFGVSRRVPRGFDFSSLSEGSRLVLIHARGWIEGDLWPWYADERRDESGRAFDLCPKRIYEHGEQSPRAHSMCAGIWRLDLEGGEPVLDPAVPFRTVERTMPGFSYLGKRSPDGVTASYGPAIFASFPIARIEVVRDPAGSHVATAERVSRGRIPFGVEAG
jgi:hypothetical protein